MSEPTPGTWEFYGPSDVQFVFDHEASVGPDAADGRSGPIAIVSGKDDEQAMANARLIAAAPELLSALQAMLESFDFLMGEASPLGDVQKGVIRGAFVTAMQDGKLTTADALARRAIATARPAPAGNESEDAR